MATARVLSIAAGGTAASGGGAGGGGAGGFRDENDIELVDFVEYDVVVGENSASEINSYILPPIGVIETGYTSLASSEANPDTETANVTTVRYGEEIWAEINISNSLYYRAAQISIEGVVVVSGYDGNQGKHFVNVTSLVTGKNTVTIICSSGRSSTASVRFLTGHTIFSIGGGNGGVGEGGTGKPGGSGGGGAGDRDDSGSGGTRVSGQGFAGGGGAGGNGASGGTPSRPDRGGGGGGANQAGGSGGDSGYGGQGKLSDITGTSVRYAGGGRGTPNGANGDGQANAGGGGDAQATDKSGKDGTLIVRYTRADVPHTFTGGTITDIGGDRIHTFTSNGKLTPFLPPNAIPALII